MAQRFVAAVGTPRIATKSATPIAPPTWRAVWLTAELTPKRSADRLDSAAAESTGNVRPIPRPISNVPGSHCARKAGSGPTTIANQSKPVAKQREATVPGT